MFLPIIRAPRFEVAPTMSRFRTPLASHSWTCVLTEASPTTVLKESASKNFLRPGKRRAPAVHGLAGDVRKLFEELILRFLPHVGHVLPVPHFHHLSHDPAVLGSQVQHVKIEHEVGGVVRVHRTSRSLALLSPCVWCAQMSSTYCASWRRLLMSECGGNTARLDSSAMWQFTAQTRISCCTSGKTEGDTDPSRNRSIKVVSARRDVKCIHPLVLPDDPLQILAETARITSSFIAGMFAKGVSRHSSGRFLGARFFFSRCLSTPSSFIIPCTCRPPSPSQMNLNDDKKKLRLSLTTVCRPPKC